DLDHRPIDEFEFPERGPFPISGSPSLPGSQPDRESLGKILSGMGLCIPCVEMQNVPATARIRLVKVRIGLRKRTEDVAPISFAMQGVGIAESVARFMTHYPHALDMAHAFGLEHEFALELHQTGLSQVERYRKPWDSVRRKPFLGKPYIGFEFDLALV